MVICYSLYILNFFKKNTKNKDHFASKIENDIESIIRSIEELSDEQREIVKGFKTEMNKFVTDRSLESCIQTLNLSIQLANTREKLLKIYQQYCSVLEDELKRLLNNDSKEKSNNN